MNYKLVKDSIDLIQEFEEELQKNSFYKNSITGFKQWIADKNELKINEPDWEGKENGRSPDSVINTLLVHLNRYAKSYSKSAIYNSDFSTQEDFAYLINLQAFGEMSKMELIKKNVQDKPSGIQVINRLIKKGWVSQKASITDKRSKLITITSEGKKVLKNQMDKIRQASKIVTGNLSEQEKIKLIHLLQKLDTFHYPIYLENLNTSELLETVSAQYLNTKN